MIRSDMKYVALFFVGFSALVKAEPAPVEIIEVGSSRAAFTPPPAVQAPSVSQSENAPTETSPAIAPLGSVSIQEESISSQSPEAPLSETPAGTLEGAAPPMEDSAFEGPMASQSASSEADLLRETVAQLTARMEELEKKISDMSKPAVQEKPQRPVDMQQKKTAEGMTALMEELQPEMPAAPQKEPPKEPLTPEKMYEEARGFITQADYTKARGALATFVEKHPNHPLVPAAFYWTGETYFVEKNYGAAAKQFLDGYKKDPKGSKAADNLLKLALSLENMGKKKEACATVKKLLKTGTKMNGSIRSVAERLQERLNCGSK